MEVTDGGIFSRNLLWRSVDGSPTECCSSVVVWKSGEELVLSALYVALLIAELFVCEESGSM